MLYSAIKNRKRLIGKTMYATKLGRYGVGLVASLFLLYGFVFLVRAF